VTDTVPTLCRLVRVLGSGVIVAGLAAHAPAADSPRGLELAGGVTGTLSARPQLQLAPRQVDAADGAPPVGRPPLPPTPTAAPGPLAVRPAPFHLPLTRAATPSRPNTLGGTGAPAVKKDLLYTAGAQRLLRNGVLVTSEVSLTRSLLSHSLGINTDTADVRL